MCKVIEDMRKEEREAGIREGMKQGMKQGMMTTARRMLETGKYALEEIADISGLSMETGRESADSRSFHIQKKRLTKLHYRGSISLYTTIVVQERSIPHGQQAI